MGTPDFAVPTLSELLGAGHDIAAVYTQPPRAAVRVERHVVVRLKPAACPRRIDAEVAQVLILHPLGRVGLDRVDDAAKPFRYRTRRFERAAAAARAVAGQQRLAR